VELPRRAACEFRRRTAPDRHRHRGAWQRGQPDPQAGRLGPGDIGGARHPDGAAVWVAVHRMALRPLEEEIERREAVELDLQSSRRELEVRVRERTFELAGRRRSWSGRTRS